MNIRQVVSPLFRLYWRVFKPRTYGVKAVIPHPDDAELCLMVRHTYGETSAWNFPGGGYKPKRESAEDAVCREVREELGLTCEVVARLEDYYTDAQGKRDTVAICVCSVEDATVAMNGELAETTWLSAREVASDKNYYRIVRFAAEQYVAGQLAEA